MFFEQYTHEPAIAVVRFLVAYSGEAERYASVIERKTADGYRALDALERHLGRGDGATWSASAMRLADIALYAYTHVAGEGGFDLGRLSGDPSLARPGRGGAGPRPDRRLSRS